MSIEKLFSELFICTSIFKSDTTITIIEITTENILYTGSWQTEEFWYNYENTSEEVVDIFY